ncbi:MAG: hypothetical protein QM755_21370 [Luteolibacter sp.]
MRRPVARAGLPGPTRLGLETRPQRPRPEQRGCRTATYAGTADAPPLKCHGTHSVAESSTFTEVSGAIGAYDVGNAWLMHGKYGTMLIATYEKALGFWPGWKEASDNRALAIARRDWMKASDKYQGAGIGGCLQTR